MGNEVRAFARLHKLGVLGAVVTFGVVLAIALGTGSAGAAPRVIVLGAATPVAASCPTDCLVEARVTGYQTSIGRAQNPFMVRTPGKIVAWSIKLGAPTAKQIDFFNDRFGPSRARLSILKPIPKKKRKKRGPQFTLARQSPIEDLQQFFGTTTTFTLQRPLKVGRGQVVALTMPTWTPAFARGQASGSGWRASRKATPKRGGCTIKGGFANLEAGAPQEKVGSRKMYGCGYRGARLLYSATVVPRP